MVVPQDASMIIRAVEGRKRHIWEAQAMVEGW